MPRASAPPSPPPGSFARWRVVVAEEARDGPLCLALANTRNWRYGDAPVERLNAYADLAAWALRRGVFDANDAAAAARLAAANPRAARAELARAIALREAICRVFAARAHDREPARTDVAALEAALAAALAAVELAPLSGRIAPRAGRATALLERPRHQAALSAAALHAGPDGARVKECADDRGCGWLFVDTTRNGSRRFCFSNECGNRARQAAFRARHRHDDAPIGSARLTRR